MYAPSLVLFKVYADNGFLTRSYIKDVEKDSDLMSLDHDFLDFSRTCNFSKRRALKELY
jgi:hypothetical protein